MFVEQPLALPGSAKYWRLAFFYRRATRAFKCADFSQFSFCYYLLKREHFGREEFLSGQWVFCLEQKWLQHSGNKQNLDPLKM